MTTPENDATPPTEAPDGSTNITEEQKEWTEQLGDGSETDAPEPTNDTDTVSGGEPDDN